MVSQTYVDAPPRPAREGGIKSVATFVRDPRLGIVQRVDYNSDGCTFAQTAIGLCYGEQTGVSKVPTGIGLTTTIGLPFGLYAGVECFLEADNSDFPGRARAALEATEDRGIEARLATWLVGGTALAAGATIKEAIANVEEALDDEYVGRGVIILSRGDAVLAKAAGALESGVQYPTTVNGTPVLASGQIPRGTVFGSGAILVIQSDVTDIDAINPTTNDAWAIAERVYAVLVDCGYRVKSAITA